MSEADQWADIAQQNATLLTSALERLATVERERDELQARLQVAEGKLERIAQVMITPSFAAWGHTVG